MPRGDEPVLVLASGSETRARLMAAAGIPHQIDPASLDEAEVRAGLLAEDAPHFAVAETLAELKALQVSRRREDAVVLGADQVMSCDGTLFGKAGNPDKARAQLRALSGKPHSLHTSVCAVRNADVLWHHNSESVLHMRALSDAFIEEYADRIGEAAYRSSGIYRLEGPGIQLFSRIEGDFFDILGLPMLPLLEFLRNNGLAPR